MGGRLIDQWLADQGFIVAAVDNRGTPGRGRDWEKAVSKHFGSVPLEDQIAGLKALGKRFPEMDLERVGVYGWSFGGYLSALAVLRAPDVFKAAVAGAPVVDWLDYDTHYTERYLGLPDADAAAYQEASLLTYAADLKRPLLLVHGTADDNVYFRHTLKLTNALFRAGKDFDLLPLAGHDAHDARPGGDGAAVRTHRRALPEAPGRTGSAVNDGETRPYSKKRRTGMRKSARTSGSVSSWSAVTTRGAWSEWKTWAVSVC